MLSQREKQSFAGHQRWYLHSYKTNIMEYRIEKDTMGEVKVPSDKYWGAQTERSRNNFKIGGQQMPQEVVYGFAYLKKAAAFANHELGVLEQEKADLIAQACDEILEGKLDDQGDHPSCSD